MKKLYVTEKKGTCYILGTLEERAELNKQGKGYLIPWVQNNDNLTIMQGEAFYTAPLELRDKRTFLNNYNKV